MTRRLGREPLKLGFTANNLGAALAGRRAPVKAALLDQRAVAGVGNIYADEALGSPAYRLLLRDTSATRTSPALRDGIRKGRCAWASAGKARLARRPRCGRQRRTDAERVQERRARGRACASDAARRSPKRVPAYAAPGMVQLPSRSPRPSTSAAWSPGLFEPAGRFEETSF